jgi:hypothetical protein
MIRSLLVVPALCAGVAQASFTSSPFPGGDAGFNALTNNGALERAVTEGRIGDNLTTGAWERAIWRQGGVGTPERSGQFRWTNAVPADFSVSFDGASTVTFTLGAETLTWDGLARSFTDIFIRTRAAADSRIELAGMTIGSLSLGSLVSEPTGGQTSDVDYLRISNGGAPIPAFTLAGRATLSWAQGLRPSNSALAFQVKLTNVIPAPGACALFAAAGLAARRRRR